MDARVWRGARPMVQAQVQAKGSEAKTSEKAEGEEGEGEEGTQGEGECG